MSQKFLLFLDWEGSLGATGNPQKFITDLREAMGKEGLDPYIFIASNDLKPFEESSRNGDLSYSHDSIDGTVFPTGVILALKTSEAEPEIIFLKGRNVPEILSKDERFAASSQNWMILDDGGLLTAYKKMYAKAGANEIPKGMGDEINAHWVEYPKVAGRNREEVAQGVIGEMVKRSKMLTQPSPSDPAPVRELRVPGADPTPPNLVGSPQIKRG